FGLSLPLRASLRLTLSGVVLGTPAYMAPEQAGGGAVDERTDVHGLGALLYALLTGRPPRAVEGGVMAAIAAVLHEDPTPPRALRPEVPAALEAVCLRALARAPEQRFPDMAALARALEEARAGRAPGAPGGRRPGR